MMRVQYKVSPNKGGWQVQRGFTEPLQFEAFETALRVAETLARAASQGGDTGVVKVVGQDLLAPKLFAPESRPMNGGVRFDPEGDEAQRYGRALTV